MPSLADAGSSPLSLHDALPILVGRVVPCDLRAAPRGSPVVRDVRPGSAAHRLGMDLEAGLCRIGTVAHDLSPLNVQDRKSTRLNSSHVSISYAVFCLT